MKFNFNAVSKIMKVLFASLICIISSTLAFVPNSIHIHRRLPLLNINKVASCCFRKNSEISLNLSRKVIKDEADSIKINAKEVLSDAESDSMEQLFKLIVNAVEEGREEDLVKAGMKVTKKSKMQEFKSKLGDIELNRRILGEPDEDQLEIMKRLKEIQNSTTNDESDSVINEYKGSLALSPDIIDKLRSDAILTIQAMRQQGTTMAALIEDNSKVSGEDFMARLDSIDITKIDKSNNEAFLESSNSPQIAMMKKRVEKSSETSTNNGSNFILKNSDNNTSENQILGTSSELPFSPSLYANDIYDDDKFSQLNDLIQTSDENKITQENNVAFVEIPVPLITFSTLPPEKNIIDQNIEKSTFTSFSSLEETIKKEISENNLTSQISSSSSSETSSSSGTATSMSLAFQELLKVSMDDSQAAAELTPEDIRRDTVDAIASGEMDQLDIKSIMGEAMSLLSEQLGINVQSELTDVNSQNDMQSILSSTMSELNANMKEIDTTNRLLYEKLANLQSDLAAETIVFESGKSEEWETLLATQAMMSTQLQTSKKTLELSAADLQALVAEYEDTVGGSTSIALFPKKSVQKKVAFVGALALLFKVPFDAARLFFLSGFTISLTTDFNDWFTIFTQAMLSIGFFHYYGLFGANNKINMQQQKQAEEEK